MRQQFKDLLEIYARSRQKGYTTRMIRSLRGGEVIVVPNHKMAQVIEQQVIEYAKVIGGFEPESISYLTTSEHDLRLLRTTDRPILIDKSVFEQIAADLHYA